MKRTQVHTREKAVALRRQGKSYTEIGGALGIRSKGTLSAWLKDVALAPRAQKKLRDHAAAASVRNFATFNQSRALRIQAENSAAFEKGVQAIRTPSAYELCLIGAALYWGEGTKSVRPKKELLSFANSDPAMIAVFLKFLRQVFEVPESKIRAGVHIYASTDESQTRSFWSTVTGLPQDRFYIVRQVSRASKGIRDPRALPHGTAVIRVNDRALYFRMKGILHGLSKITLG